MPIVSENQQYQLVRSDGTVILKGGFSQLMEAIPQSTARLDAEQAIAAAKVAKAREQRLDAKADSLAKRESEVQARERQADAAAMKAFCDGVSAVGKRLDALEEAERQERLAAEIAAADAALKALQADEGDLEPKESPNQRDAEEIEAQGGATEAETAIGKSDDQMSSGGSPSLAQRRQNLTFPLSQWGRCPASPTLLTWRSLVGFSLAAGTGEPPVKPCN
jgi:hypothetical protein